MGQISLQIPQTGQPNSTEDPKIASNFTTIQTAINGNLDHSNLATGVVLELALTGTTRAVAFGTSTVTFTALNHSNVVTVTHGLTRTPQCVVCTAQDYGFITSANVAFSVGAPGATTFTVTGEASAAVSGAVTFYWLAIG